MSYDLVIRGGRLATSEFLESGDVAVRDGRIAAIGDLGDVAAAEVLDASGLIVMPGIVDTQVHFREPGLEQKEDLESGTRSALMGGVTSILEMPNTSPPTTSRTALENKLTRAKGRAWCHYGFFVGASPDNAEQLGELEELPGTPGVKIFMGSSTGTLLVSEDEHLRRVLAHGRRRCPVHCEDEPRNLDRRSLISGAPHVREHPFLRDAESARLATERLIRLSRETGRPIHVLHVSTSDELPLLRSAKAAGVDVTCELTPQHLTFSSDDYEELGTRLQQNPPIRDRGHRDALRRALLDGLFDVIGSDHAPHTKEEKARPYPQSPSGMPGVQTMLPAMLTLAREVDLSIPRLVALLCENPARLYGIQGKGALREGYDADLVLVDPDRPRLVEASMIESKCGWSPYEGRILTGWPVHVVLNGRLAVREGERISTPMGRMLEYDWKGVP
jgi:dihydroorotase